MYMFSDIICILQEIVERYKYARGQVDLSGPTNFSGVIEKAMWYAKEGVSQKKQRYYILLIITVRNE